MEIDSEDGRNSEAVVDAAPTELDKPASPTEVTDTAESPGELADTDSEQGELPAWAQSVEGEKATVSPLSPPVAAADAVARNSPAATRPVTTAAAAEEPVAGGGAHAAAPHPSPAEAPAATKAAASLRPPTAAKIGQADVLATLREPAEIAKAAVPVDPAVTGEGSDAAASPQGITPAASTAPAAAALQTAFVVSTPSQAAAAASASPDQLQASPEKSSNTPGTSKEGPVVGQSDVAQSRAAAVPAQKQADMAPTASVPQAASPEAFISFEGLGDATAEADAARHPGPHGGAEPMELDGALPAPVADGSSTLHFMPLGQHASEPPARAQPPPPDVDAQTPQGGAVALTAAGCAAVGLLWLPPLTCTMSLQDPARRHCFTAQCVHPAAP